MAGYIGKVQIGANVALVGSTLYGICNTPASTAAKTAIGGVSGDDNSGKFINNNYDNLIQGTTIHVKFVHGNTVASNMTLQVGTTNQAKAVVGKCVCDEGTIISFTYDENEHWVVNDNVDTNTEYVFKSQYDPTNKRVITENDIGGAAEKDVVTNLTNNTASTDLPTAAAVASYVDFRTAGLSGLTGAMHFKGAVQTIPDATASSTFTSYDAGDVILGPNDKEYVYSKGASAAESEWIELGDESSYALKSSTDTVTEVGVFTQNTLPTLTVTDTSVSQVNVTNGSAADLETETYSVPEVTQAGTATTASVSAGILNITIGQDTTLAVNNMSIKGVKTFTTNTPTAVTSTPVTVGSASGWNAGSQASLSTNNVTVIVPDNNTP